MDPHDNFDKWPLIVQKETGLEVKGKQNTGLDTEPWTYD